MKAGFFIIILALAFTNKAAAQKSCIAQTYQQSRLKENPSLADNISRVESFIKQHISAEDGTVAARGEEAIIRIPVVVHILYHYPGEKVTDEQVMTQIAALNQCYRRRNADTIKTPSYFKPFAADCNIEFKLATSDPRKRSTSGIIRKYTPVTEWEADDKMKYSAQMGDDAWDSKSYLNIWVCNLNRVAGYASIPGDAADKDGVVIGFNAFGTINTQAGYEMGKTAVHEVGHWLGLKHIWGDDYCGDDGVADTPKQAGYNIECPSGINVTCGSNPYGDMYMNYMDLTNDGCMNLFTLGQKARMRSLFAAGGARFSLLSSAGLNPPLFFDIPVPEEDPKWLHPQLFPNPATNQLTLDLAYDVRWLGKMIHIINLQGQTIMTLPISNKTQLIDISKLKAGIYFLATKREDGLSVKLKFVKL